MKFNKVLLNTVIGTAALIVPSLVYGQAYGTVATETLNVREGAKIDSNIIKQVGLGESVEIVSEQGDWLKLILEDDSRAYVSAEYINVHRVLAVVKVNGSLNVRDYPSTTNGKVIGRFTSGDEISVHFRVGDWYKISQEDFEGYVSKDFVTNSADVDFLKYLPTKSLTEIERMTVTQEEAQQSMVEVETSSSNTSGESYSSSHSSSSSQSTGSSSNSSSSNNSSSSSSSSSSTSGDAVVAYAKQFLGNPYVYGGNSLTNGIDCSGFTSQVMRHFGVSLNRNSSAQYANNGYYVSSDSLQKGDLLFYGYSGKVSHVAIYIGGGQIIHANDERTGICIGNAFPSSGKRYIGAKRVL